jgi:membrane protease subunit (stomatin/prohibitin family)
MLKGELGPHFNDFGLQLTNFFVQSLSLPEELQAHLDKLGAMRMTGDLQQYAQFQAADSIKTAAANPGGVAGIGAGFAAGQAISQAIMNSTGPKISSDDAIQKINQLHELVKSGALSQTEFDAKKAELLKKIT